MNPIANNLALALSFFLCISFLPLLNALPDITKTCDKVKHKELCIEASRNRTSADTSPTMPSRGPVPLTPEVRAKYGICDQEVVSAMKELDKVRTAMEAGNHRLEKLNMKAAA
ncbi:hypothetical protein V6N12_057858 [Hibiscus sabdariffa]|uniref:Uncharacterized protein n=1 Tax=Hibiscus sabdariffa TaxID=183260 RepID=A0ABR2B3W1_9ROSI